MVGSSTNQGRVQRVTEGLSEGTEVHGGSWKGSQKVVTEGGLRGSHGGSQGVAEGGHGGSWRGSWSIMEGHIGWVIIGNLEL